MTTQTSTVDPTDEALMVGVQAHRAEALERLYDRYGAVLKALILQMLHNHAEADDLLQEVFVELWGHAGNYSAKKGRPLGWLVTIARRRAIDRLRKREAYARAEERLVRETEQQPEAWSQDGVANVLLQDMHEVLTDILQHISPVQRQIIELAFFKGMSQREIAAATNTPLGTVKTRMELGLRRIAEMLRHYRDEF